MNSDSKPTEMEINPEIPNETTTKQSQEEEEKPLNEGVKKRKKRDEESKSTPNFFYDHRRKTVLGRDSLNWAKLSCFYGIFFFCLGCFFVMMLYVFALILDREVPTYYNSESTMAVRTTATVVGMGFRPQPEIDTNLIRVSDDEHEQKKIASSLRLFRDVYLRQRSDAETKKCSENAPASILPRDVACTFSWFDIVQNQDHPCSDNNYYGFKKQEPCVLVKVNKVYGWTPTSGPIPSKIQDLQGLESNRSHLSSEIYITCDGTNPVDQNALTGEIIYYSLTYPTGTKKYGSIPNYYFPYRNAKAHVQPFILVQFKDLPRNHLISVTCRLWGAGIEQDSRGMRGMTTFQLFRQVSPAEEFVTETTQA